MSKGRHVLLSVVAVAALAGLVLQRRLTPVRVSTKQLWGDRDAWTGRKVDVSGELKEFESGTTDDHFALENDGFRVGVRGLTPAELTGFLGRRVRARGVFVFTEKTGGYLESPELTPE